MKDGYHLYQRTVVQVPHRLPPEKYNFFYHYRNFFANLVFESSKNKISCILIYMNGKIREEIKQKRLTEIDFTVGIVISSGMGGPCHA